MCKLIFSLFFQGGDTDFSWGPFQLDPSTGYVRLRQALQGGLSVYNLVVEARDDGSCCPDAPGMYCIYKFMSSLPLYLNSLVDNLCNKPTFIKCSLKLIFFLKGVPHTTRGKMIVDFIGVNRPPQFGDCRQYSPTLRENQGEGATVLEVMFISCRI